MFPDLIPSHEYRKFDKGDANANVTVQKNSSDFVSVSCELLFLANLNEPEYHPRLSNVDRANNKIPLTDYRPIPS